MLVRVWRSGDALYAVMEMYIGAAIMENHVDVSQENILSRTTI